MTTATGDGAGQPPAPYLRIAGLHKSFGATEVLRGVDLDVVQGEVLALLGRSGSGKSTLLRLLAGFEEADSGRLELDGVDFSRRDARSRGFGMVFQSYALFPHLTVARNVAFGLRDLGPGERRDRVAEMLDLVQLGGLGDRAIDEISGGQQQRVALARALAPSPALLLLDEPLSNLDPSLRERTREQLLAVVRGVGITTVLVTHEQEEAFELGDRVAVLEAGAIEQVGSPLDLYREPRTPFVARFVGRSTVLPARARRREGGWQVAVEEWRGELVVDASCCVGDPPTGESTVRDLWLRPEHLELADPLAEAPAALHVDAEVTGSRLLGPYTLVRSRTLGPRPSFVEVAHPTPMEVGRRVRVVLRSPRAVRLLSRS